MNGRDTGVGMWLLVSTIAFAEPPTGEVALVLGRGDAWTGFVVRCPTASVSSTRRNAVLTAAGVPVGEDCAMVVDDGAARVEPVHAGEVWSCPVVDGAVACRPIPSADLTVVFPPDSTFYAVALRCPSGRVWATVRAGRAVVHPAPVGEDCAMYAVGGPPLAFEPVRGGQTVSCQVDADADPLVVCAQVGPVPP